MKRALIILMGLFCIIACNDQPKRPTLADRITDSIKQQEIYLDSIKQVQERHASEYRRNDSLHYLIEPYMPAEEVKELKPVLKKWLDFYRIDLSQFKVANTTVFGNQFAEPGDTASIHYQEFDIKFHGRYLPKVRDYSPNRRRYINVLETTCVYQDEKDKKWYYSGSDDCQELRFVDLDCKIDVMFWFTGTNFIDAAFWKGSHCFIITSYDMWHDEYSLAMYDLSAKQKTNYRMKAPHPDPKRSYLEHDMKSRGIILDL